MVAKKPTLNVEERNLLSVAYKNVVGARRASWRVLDSIEAGTQEEDKVAEKSLAAKYKGKVEQELEDICDEVITLLQKTLLPSAESQKEDLVEAKVFYMKMGGDYQRYLAEFQQGKSKEATIEAATTFYKNATSEAEHLAPTDPIRLGLALNYSVFFYEIVQKKADACKLAKKAFDDAVANLDDLPEDAYKDATLIMQLLRDNLTLWDPNNAGEGPVEDDAVVEDL